MRASLICGSLILALAVSGCTYETGQSTQAPPPAVTQDQSPGVVGPTPTAPELGATPVPLTTTIPVSWANLNLKGKLVYMRGGAEYDRFTIDIEVLDLKTGEVRTAFASPNNSWIYYATVSADGKQLAMSYAPPPQNGVPSKAAIFTMPLDGSEEPKLLFEPPTPNDQEIQVEWSPDGGYIYYTEVNYQIPPEPAQVYPVFRIYRRALPDGSPELIAEKAYWPRLSADSSRLVYVFVDPFSVKNELYVADPDGGHAQSLSLSGPWIPDTKDAPLFAPDGTSVLFSGPAPFPAYKPNWIEGLMGIQIAKADGAIPSDWWSVPQAGGELTQLTHLQTLALYGSVAPDKKHIASFSSDGIFVMNPDGSSVTVVVPTVGGVAGTVTWIP